MGRCFAVERFGVQKEVTLFVGGEDFLSVRQLEAHDVKSDWLNRPLNGRSTQDQITDVLKRFFNSL